MTCEIRQIKRLNTLVRPPDLSIFFYIPCAVFAVIAYQEAQWVHADLTIVLMYFSVVPVVARKELLLIVIQLAQLPLYGFFFFIIESNLRSGGLVRKLQIAPGFRLMHIYFSLVRPHPVIFRIGSSCLRVYFFLIALSVFLRLPVNPAEINSPLVTLCWLSPAWHRFSKT